MIAKLIAGLLVKQIMLEAASDKNEETIKLTKEPGKEGPTELAIKVKFKCKRNRIPMYCEKIIASAASAANVSFEEMIKHVTTCHELMGEVSKEKTTTKNKEAKNED